MKAFTCSIFASLFIILFSLQSFSQDIIIDDINLSGSFGPGSFITFHDLYVLDGDSLEIEAGTTIKFTQGTSMIVYGCLLSVGTSSSPVIYKSSGELITWEGISFPSNKAGNSRTDEVWESKFSYSQFEDVVGLGAILFTTDNPFVAIESISNCTFLNLENAISFFFALQSNILIQNSTFSGVENTAITIGNTEATAININGNDLNELSNRFLYIYSNGLLSSMTINSNDLDNLVLDKSVIRLENNGSLGSLQMKHNGFSNFESENTYPVEEGFIYCKDLDNLNTFQLEDNRIDEILYDQDLTTSIKSFIHLLYGKSITIDKDTVTRVKNLEHYFLADDCETITINQSKYDDVACEVALFRLVPEKSGRINNSWFENIITNSGNGCFYFDGIAAMDDIIFSSNHFKSITADNGPCLNINSPEGAIDSIVFSGNIIEQNRIGFLSKNGGVGYIRMNSVEKFRTESNNISNCKVTNYGGVYYFDVSSVTDINVFGDNLNYIESTNNGGYISVINTIFNENLRIDGLTVDSCFTNIGSGGIVFLQSENENTGEVSITNCTLNYFHAGSAETQHNGGGFYLEGNYLDLVFSGNKYNPQQSDDLFPVANNGGILYYEHGGVLGTVTIEDNEFARDIPLEVSGSGACIYLASEGNVNFIVISGNTTGNFKASGNGGAYYFNLQGGCGDLNIVNNNISDCSAGTSGGALFFQSFSLGRLMISSLDETGQIFSDCRAVNGYGGMAYIKTTEQINDADIEYNTILSTPGFSNAAADGGFLFVECGGEQTGEVIITHNIIGDNNGGISAGANGGVFYFNIAGSCHNVDIHHNEITGCLSGESGGALYFKSAGIYEVNVEYNEINELTADGNGGAFYFDLQGNCNSLDIRGNDMMNCAADTSGGALYFRSNGIDSINVSGYDMVSQELRNCVAANGSGGAIYIHSLSQAVNTVDIKYNDIQSSLSGNNSKLDGGAIYLRSVGGDVEHVEVSNNTSGDDDSGISSGGNGGTVYLDFMGRCNSLDIRDNSFSNSIAEGSGGAVYFKSNGIDYLSIEGSEDLYQQFRNCRAMGGSGGSLYINSLTRAIASSDIIFNDIQSSDNESASADGGGMFLKSGDAPVTYVNLHSNTIGTETFGLSAGGNGGAFYFELLGNCDTFSILDNIITNGAAANSGGAVYFKSSAGIMDLASISGNVFGNAATGLGAGNNGGAVYMELAGNCEILSVLNNKFLKCTSNGSGGALYFKSSELETLGIAGSEDEQQLFNNCNTGNAGGSIYIRTNVINSAGISENAFVNSQANVGGAIAFEANTINDFTVISSLFQNCQASSNGGSMHFEGLAGQLPSINVYAMQSCRFTNSVSENGMGGAVYYKGDLEYFQCQESSFETNACNDSNEGYGGAIYFNLQEGVENNLVFSHDTITGCESATGALYLENADQVSFTDSYFKSNNAADNGAAIAIIHFGTVDITNSLFSQNRSGLNGGALYLGSGQDQNSVATIGTCAFEFNNSVNGGALSFDDFATAVISSNDFIQNSCFGGGTGSEYRGGAICSNLNSNLEITGNNFIRNTAVDPAQPEILSNGGSLAVIDNEWLNVIGNKFHFSEAKNGGAIYIKNNNNSIPSIIFQHENEFFQNKGEYGGAIFADMMEQDNLSSIKNLFFDNEADFSGGAIDLRNLDGYNSTRDIFRSNTNNGLSPTGIIGGSALFALGVADISLYNSVFEENTYSNNTGLEKKPSVWIKNHETAYIENCTFLKQLPNDQSVIIKEGNDDPLIIKNSIFAGNLDPQTPLTNANAVIDHSFLEGLITDDLEITECFDFPLPLFMTDSYILNDADTSFIDFGDPLEIYNDSIHNPIGKGTDRSDLGVSGGRYNVWDEDDLQKPLLNDFTRPVIIERYNDVCGLYKIYFSLLEGDVFDNFKWYVNDSIFITGNQNLLIKYVADDEILAVTGIAKNNSTGMIVVGNNTVNTYREITYSGTLLSFAGSDYECGDIITMNDTCPSAVTGMYFSVQDLRMPYFGSYEHEWNITGGSGISGSAITEESYDEITFDLQLTQDTIAERSIAIEYRGYDYVCDIELIITCEITFIYSGLTGYVEMVSIAPAETLLEASNPVIEIEFNRPLYYCNGATIYKIAEGTVGTSLGIVEIQPAAGDPVSIESLEYINSKLVIRPSMANFPKGDYTIIVANICNACGFTFNGSYPVNIKYVGIDDPGLQEINIWPNPSSEKVFIDIAAQKEQLRFEIYNSTGKSILEDIMIPGDKYELDVSEFPQGIYFVKIYDPVSREWFLKKLIVE